MEQQKTATFPVSSILMILVALGVVVFTKTPLKETRPPVTEMKEQSGQVRARLWQDPFRAVLDQAPPQPESAPTSAPTGTNVQPFQLARLAGKIDSSATGTVTILGVMVFGGPYIDDSEHRIRMRYAVLAGLRRLGYYPKNSDFLDFVRTDGSNVGPLTFRNILPFEWLEKLRGKKQEAVLVAWINEDVLQQTPLELLTAGFEGLSKPGVSVKVIGPAGSTTLVNMFMELKGATYMSSPEQDTKPCDLKIFSPCATVDIALLKEFRNIVDIPSLASHGTKTVVHLADTSVTGEGRLFKAGRLAATYNRRNILFEQTISTDTVLAKGLIRELALRGIDLERKDCAGSGGIFNAPRNCGHVALISEWDTFYGRMLPATFRKAVRHTAEGKKKGLNSDSAVREAQAAGKKKNETEQAAGRIHRFNYLRGMDGALPGEQPQKKEKAADSQAVGLDLQTTTSNLEQAMGRSQYDYLRRLADSVYQLDLDLKKDGRGGIDAVGILGSDFYDKYLVLQAMKQRFPDAVYFTTDLDARFLQQDYLNWTRNVVVASAYGFALPYRSPGKLLQGEVPPFRDSYQTSVFLTTMAAFDDDYRTWIKPDETKIFEIGRQQAYELTGGDVTREEAAPSLQHDASRMKDAVKYGAIVIAALLLLALSVARVRDAALALIDQAAKRPAATAGVAAAIIVLAALFSRYILGDSDQEPVTFGGGISIWPTEIIRLLAAAFSLLLIKRANRELKENFETIDNDFKFSVLAKGRDAALWENRDKSRFGLCYQDKSASGSMRELWRSYATLSTVVPRNVRIVVYCLACAALSMTLMWTFGPPVTPVRGKLSWWVDKFVLFITVGGFLYLTFLVVDAARLCRDFVRSAARTTPAWNGNDKGAWTEREEWDLIRIIGTRTEAVGKLVFYPFIVWFLLFLSRMRLFDNWNTPLHLAAITTLSAVYAWSCAYRLRKAAELARSKCVERLTARIVELRTGPKADIPQADRVRYVVSEVTGMRQGAFSLFTQSPVVQSLLVPFGGVGGITLLDMFTKINL